MKKTWSRKKINDEFTGMKTAAGKPMSRQQVHMMRKKAQGLCLTCAEPAIGVYCLKHTVAARERMREKLNYNRRLRTSGSYVLEQKERAKRRLSRARTTARTAASVPAKKAKTAKPIKTAKPAQTKPRSKAKSAKK